MIEDKIDLLIAALTANTEAQRLNTEALNKAMAMSGTPAAAPIVINEPPAPKKTKTPKAEPVVEAEVVTEPVAEETPASEPEPTSEPATEEPEPETPIEAFPSTRDAALNVITLKVRGIFATAGNQLSAKKEAYEKIRGEFGVAKAPDLKDDQLQAFYDAVCKL